MRSERQAAPAAAGEGPAGAVSPLTTPGGDSYLKTEDRPQTAGSPTPRLAAPGAARTATPQGAGPMATSTESNPPAKDVKDKGAKDTRGLSGLSESNLEQSVLRRGLATAQEIEACKAHRAKLAAASSNKDEPAKSLLDIMVEAKVLTKNQSLRLLKEAGPEADEEARDPRLPDPRRRSARGRWGSSTRRSRRASTGSSPSRSCSTPWRRTRNSSSGSSARRRSPPSSRTTTSSTPSTPARSTATTSSSWSTSRVRRSRTSSTRARSSTRRSRSVSCSPWPRR